jgi:apolipoprotein N-acyltransferase
VWQELGGTWPEPRGQDTGPPAGSAQPDNEDTMAAISQPITRPSNAPAPPHRNSGRSRDAANSLALLLCAGASIAMSTSNHAVALAAWLAPILMVRFLRTQPTGRGLLAGAVVNAVAFSWAWHAQWPVPPVLLAGLATVFFLPYLADRLLAGRLSPLLGTLVLPLSLVVVEHALVHLPLLEGTPIGSWAAVVHSQQGQLPLLQLLAVTGSAGIAFLIAWTATVTNLVWERGLRADAVRRIAAGLVVALLLVLTLGAARLAFAAAPSSTVRVAGVAIDNDEILVRTWSPVRQGTPLTDGDREQLAAEIAALHEQLFELSERGVAAGADIVTWAEDNALVFREEAQALIDRGRAFAKQHDIALFMGMVVLEPGQPADNQVVGITPDGEVAFTYLKAFPAPGEGSRRGDGQLAWMDTRWGRIGVAICFDYDFPALIRQAGRAGIDIMINPADDTPAIDPLHPNMAIPRAIENGFAMIRPAQGARSIAVDGYGRTLAVQEATHPARHFAVDLPTTKIPTISPHIGDLLAYLAMTGLVLVTIQATRPRNRPDRPSPSRRAAAGALLVLLLAGCSAAAAGPEGHGHDAHHDHADNSAPFPDARDIPITAEGVNFSPDQIEVRAGEPVNLALTATDTFHDLNIETTGFHLGVHAGQTDRGGLLLTEPGTYIAYCSVPGHREPGMEIHITVHP